MTVFWESIADISCVKMDSLRAYQIILIGIIIKLADARILRRNCGDYADFSYTESNKALEGHILEAFIGLLPSQCEVECINNIYCKSINTEDGGTKKCELCSKTITDVVDGVSLVGRSGWTFKSTSYTDPLIGNLCKKLNPCAADHLCMDVCYSPGYVCHSCKELHSGMACRRGPYLENIASSGESSQSDNGHRSHPARLAIDGNHHTFSYIKHYPGWWKLDFLDFREIASVTIHCYDNNSNHVLKLGNSTGSVNLMEAFPLVSPNTITSINFQPHKIAHYILIQKNHIRLVIREVIVMGYNPK